MTSVCWSVLRSVMIVFLTLGLGACRSEWGQTAPEALGLAAQVRASGPVLNIKTDFGAQGDGVSNDTAAFQKAANYINRLHGGRLFIPKGQYVLGKQDHVQGRYPYYVCQKIFHVTNCAGLIIEGEAGTVLRIDKQMRFGSFDKDKGTSFDPVSEKVMKGSVFTDGRYAVGVGNLIDIAGSRDIIIRNLELDGNNTQLVLGGMWGDKGRQLMGHGLCLYQNSNVLLQKLNVHHMATDGIIIGHQGLKESDSPRPHVLVDVRSEYNGRQGMSWVGGNSLVAVHCAFNHTGRAGLSSSPAAGLDIEAEHSICRNGIFKDCEFLDNHGLGMGADSGDGGYTHFENCTFWGTKNWAIWPRKPGLSFTNCRFYGSIVHGWGSRERPELATRFVRCQFEDKENAEGNVFRGTTLITMDGVDDHIIFEDCDIVANNVKALWLTPREDASLYLRNTRVTHKCTAVADRGFQSLFRRGVVMETVHFMESFPSLTNKTFIIMAEQVKGDNVIVDGPCVRWVQWQHPATGVVWAASSKETKPLAGEKTP